MPDGDPEFGQFELPGVVGGFRVVELLSSSGDVRLYRALDEQVDRRVLLRVAGEGGAGVLLEDARRIAGVSHPALVGVLGAGLSGTAAFAAVHDLEAQPLAEVGSLSSEEADRVARDIEGSIEALSQVGLRAVIDPATVLVVRSHEGVRGLLDPLRASSSGHSCLAVADRAASSHELAALLGQLPRAAVPQPGVARRRVRAAAALLVLAACAGVAGVALERSGGTSKKPAAPAAPALAARIAASIPLGLSGEEVPLSIALAGKTVWVSTSKGRLLRVDAKRSQVAGAPIELGAQHVLPDMLTSGGSIYAADRAGWVLRIDAGTGQVTGRLRLGAQPNALRVAGGVLWVVADKGSTGVLLRVAMATLRRVGAPIEVLASPRQIEVRGSRAWVLGGVTTGKVLRVDTVSGERRLAFVGPQVVTFALDKGTLWIPDLYDGTVSALDAERMVFTRAALRAGRIVTAVATTGADLWVTALDDVGAEGPVRLRRFDSDSGRRAGQLVNVGKGFNFALRAGPRDIWVLGPTTLTRLTPAAPRPALEPPARVGPSPRPFAAGPLPAGTWRATAFAVPFTFSTPAFTWRGGFPQPDSVVLLGARDRRIELDIQAPLQMFTRDGAEPRPIGNPASVLAVLRENPRLHVGAVQHVVIGGRAALQFELRPRHPVRHPAVCGPVPCVLLYPTRESTLVIVSGDVMRVTLLRSRGRTLVLTQGQSYDKAALAATTSLLRTFHFEA